LIEASQIQEILYFESKGEIWQSLNNARYASGGIPSNITRKGLGLRWEGLRATIFSGEGKDKGGASGVVVFRESDGH